MRSPADMTIIEIDVTNHCVNRCSNCTRFCGHHRETFHMDFDFFKSAVDSLDGFDGMVGMIGGEPTLHPRFEDMVLYLQKKRLGGTRDIMREPIRDFLWFILHKLWRRDARVALCSSLTPQYYKYMEVIGDTFRTQILNDHANTCQHQALLMSRKELGIPDSEWKKKRDACWIQNQWSATITPKGAFFCEVAGSLDMLFNGPGGWPVEPGWWKRTPEDFTDQLHWCELCSGCLDVPQRVSNEEFDDVTPGIFQKLLTLGSPKALQGKCIVHDPQYYNAKNYHTFTGENDYMDRGDNKRINDCNRNIYPKNFFVTDQKNLVANLCKNKPNDWVIVTDDKQEAKFAEKYLSSRVINPGCIYSWGKIMAFNTRAMALRDRIKHPETIEWPIWQYYDVDKIIRVNFDFEKYVDEINMLKRENNRLIKECRLQRKSSLIP